MDEVAVDAKRILLRYGAPIDVLDDVGEVERIELARFIAKTLLPDRELRLHQELADRGYMEPPTVKTRKRRAKAAQRPAAQRPKPAAAKGGTSAKPKATPKPASPLKVAAKPKAKAKPKVAAKAKAKVAAKGTQKSPGRAKATSRSNVRRGR